MCWCFGIKQKTKTKLTSHQNSKYCGQLGVFFMPVELLFETRRPRGQKINPREDVVTIQVSWKNRDFLIQGLPFALYRLSSTQE